MQMNARQSGATVFLRRQLRYSFTSGSAFVMGLHEGLHGTILHERGIKYRYPALSLGEDTEFMNLFHPHVIVENDPGIYVRFHHDYNSWEENHIMKHLTGTRDRWEVDGQQKALMLKAVLPCYTSVLVGREIY